MRDLKNPDDAGNGGVGSVTGSSSSGGKPPEGDDNKAVTAPLTAHDKAVKWWDDFAAVVEDPHKSTYDFLKKSVLKNLDVEKVDGIGDLFNHAQKKAIKEVVSLTDPRELSKVIASLEKKRLFFDYRTRVGIKCARVLLDTYIKAKDEYENDIARLKKQGRAVPSASAQKAEIKKIVEEKLGEPEVAESIEAVAEALTGKDKEEIKKTVEEASRQLREKKSLSQIAGDVVGVSRKYMTLDKIVNIGVHALPLITWQYRWAIALVFGVYVSRMAAIHGYRAAKARFYDRDKDLAKEESAKALTALKAAGGNVLAIGISPLVGKLPAKLAVWAGFVASTAYNKGIELVQKLVKKKEAGEKTEQVKSGRIKSAWGWTKAFFKENLDTLVVLLAKAAKIEKPGKVSEQFEKASKRVVLTKIHRVANGVWGIGKAAGRRGVRSLKAVFQRASAAPPENGKDAESRKAMGDDERGHDDARQSGIAGAAFDKAVQPPDNTQDDGSAGVVESGIDKPEEPDGTEAQPPSGPKL